MIFIIWLDTGFEYKPISLLKRSELDKKEQNIWITKLETWDQE